MRDGCDLAHVLLLDRIERRCLAEMQATAALIAAGVPDLEMPDVQARCDEFEDALLAEPDEVDPRYVELRKALGVS